jgi:hypothetical protein
MAEAVIKKMAAAIIDVDAKEYHSMKQLLTANDVKRDQAMRVNIFVGEFARADEEFEPARTPARRSSLRATKQIAFRDHSNQTTFHV